MAKINFVELPCSDAARDAVFYAAALGWDMTAFGPSYACTTTGEVDLGLQADHAEATAAPLPVIQVEDLAATAAAIEAAGGRITRAEFAFPGGRRFHFADPSGNELAAMVPED